MILIYSVVLISLLLIITPVNYRIQRVDAKPEVLVVPDDYLTIQEAINNVVSGDVIFVRKGVYHENLLVYKRVSLIGENKDLTIVDGDGNGTVVTVTANNVTIQNFTIRNSGNSPYDAGILVRNSTGVKVSQNIIRKTNDGIRLNYSDNNMISENIVFSVSFGGIVLAFSSDNIISNNEVSLSYYGIYFYSSSNNFALSNVLSLNFYGVYLYFSTNNNVSSNTISSNYQLGIYVTFYSGGNIFYHNNLENARNVQCDMMNRWDFEGEGNYWNDYDGEDLNEDGIGDTPYVLNKQNQDDHPLIGTFSVFTVTVKGEGYNVAFISNSTIFNFEFKVGVEVGQDAISFVATGANGTYGFCRIKLPRRIIEHPYIVLVDNLELIPSEITTSNERYACLYFTYLHNSSITLLSSETLKLYYELLGDYLELQRAFSNLNHTYYQVLQNYTFLLENSVKLQEDFQALNSSFNKLLYFNQTLSDLADGYTLLIHKYTQLLQNFEELNKDYRELLGENSKQMGKIQSVIYVLVAITAVFIAAIIYLSKQSSPSRSKPS